MTHIATELTVDSAAPVELFTFTIPGTSLAWRYCTDTEPVTFSTNTWIPEAIERSEVSRKLDEPSSPMQITLGDENPLALEMLAGLTVRPVSVLVEQYHRTDAGLERVVIFTGVAAGISFEGAKAVITCLPRLAVADRRRVPWQTYQATCNWQWGSTQCGVDPEAFKLGPFALGPTAQVGAVLTIPGVHTSGNLSNGWVRRVADGDTRFIEQNIGGELVLEYPFRNISPSTEQFEVFPGCKRTEADCAGRYNNLPNFLGWSRLPNQNPFERSAFYLSTSAPAAPPAGTTADLGGGYTLTLAPQKARVVVPGSYGGNVLTTVSLTANVTGIMSLYSSPFVGRYISPNPCPAAVTNDLDVWFDSTGVAVGSLGFGPGMSVQLGVGWDSWQPLTSDASATLIAWAMSNPSTSGGAMRTEARITTAHVRIRRRSSGLVLAEGDISLGFEARVGTTSSDAGGGYPPGW